MLALCVPVIRGLAKKLPREGEKAELILNPMTGVIIHYVKRFYQEIEKCYKKQLLLSFRMQIKL